jgi:excisionase family DNA binding protein
VRLEVTLRTAAADLEPPKVKATYYSPPEAAVAWRRGLGQVYADIAAGRIRAVKFGNRYRITSEEVERVQREGLS